MAAPGIGVYHGAFSPRVRLRITVTIVSPGVRRGIEPAKL